MYKIFLAYLLVIVAGLILKTVLTGKGNKVGKNTVGNHLYYARCALFLTILLIALVDIRARIDGGTQVDIIHLCFAIPWLASFFALCFRFSGIRSKKYHAKIAYIFFIPLLMGTLITGIPMFIKFLMA